MYVKLNENKQPQQKLNNPSTLEEVKDHHSYGMLVPEPYVVIDIDDPEDFERMWQIVQDMNIKTRVLKTEKGGHFWFKSLKPLLNNTGVMTPITLPVDVRSYGKLSYVVLKLDGVERSWWRFDAEVDELPYWLTPDKKIKKDLRGLKNKDGRNNAIFSYIIPLINLRHSKEDITEIFRIINRYVFAEPLEDSELAAMLDNEIFNDSRIIFFSGNKFLHHEFAHHLRNTHFIKWYAGELWVYKDGVYISDETYLGQIMIEQIPELTTRQRKETMEYLRLLGSSAIKQMAPTYVNLPNGLLNIETGELTDHTPYIFSTNRLPTVYDPSAYSPVVDKTLDRICCNDPQVRGLLEEMVGYIFYGENTFQKAFVLTGGGSNGKSSFMKLLTYMIGPQNISTLTLGELEDRFSPPELVGKVANLGDDIPRDLIRDSSVFKRAVTGDAMTAERKGQNPFTFSNKAKLIFTANDLPPTTDKSYGFLRRMVIVPFNARFRPSDKDYDADIDLKLQTPVAASYLMNVALKGARRLLDRGKFPEVAAVTAMVEQYERDNNSVAEWLEDKGIEIVNRSAQEVYQEYMMYCASTGSKPYSARRFNKEIRERFPLELQRTTANGRSAQVWRDRKEDIE